MRGNHTKAENAIVAPACPEFRRASSRRFSFNTASNKPPAAIQRHELLTVRNTAHTSRSQLLELAVEHQTDNETVSDNNKTIAGVRVLIFDLDGTLIDSKLDLALSVNAMLVNAGRAEIAHENISALVGNGAPVLVRRALGDGASDAEVDAALAYFLSYYRAHMLDKTVLYPGVLECLQNLDGRSLAVLTNKPVRFSREILEGLGVARYFQYVYGGNSFENKKPNPIGVTTLLEHFSASPRDAMVVGDSEVDVQTARNAGTWACGVTYGFGSDRLPQCSPDFLLDNLAELPNLLNGASK
jgi:phosphoglycolate phosphatase